MFRKITIDDNDPEVKGKLQTLYAKLQGEYKFENIGDGNSEVFDVFIKNKELWVTMLSKRKSYQLYPASLDDLIFFCTIDGKFIAITAFYPECGISKKFGLGIRSGRFGYCISI